MEITYPVNVTDPMSKKSLCAKKLIELNQEIDEASKAAYAAKALELKPQIDALQAEIATIDDDKTLTVTLK